MTRICVAGGDERMEYTVGRVMNNTLTFKNTRILIPRTHEYRSHGKGTLRFQAKLNDLNS